MKTKIIISLLGLLFIAGDFVGGCEEEEEPKPDYITVNVTTNGSLLKRLTGSTVTSCEQITIGVTVRVDVIKAGGERFNLFTQTDSNCNFTAEAVSFNLYREQPIEVIAYAEQVPAGYTQVQGVDYLSWDEVYPQKDFGDTYAYSSEVSIIWLYD